MIKMIVLIKRNPALTREEFDEHWRHVHARLVRELPEVSSCMQRYVQNYMIAGAEQASDEFGDVGLPTDDLDFDGIMEAHFASMDDMTRMTSSESYLSFIRPDEEHLVDAARSKVYLTEEYVVVDSDRRPPGEAAAHGHEEAV
ncbi:EthD domain-containing protein [Aeromicrobium fastidiosum]|uniref:EthD domain-containing protein n=1 Tax=Aeromicrobium fastidiosum TaxID=52699 RepID=A0A641APQ3_9ACTN|nr:EthD domain-containing protein [Aeromicrobium fastidiosum]KAA1379915.1 EthD domain-containing protein [Aeromicrobium fastidiosum]MBP2389421.1 hypothetical protein [Aeromicrobium fastidiosum]